MLWIRCILLMGGVLFIALPVVAMVLENRQVTYFELFGLLTPEPPVVLYVALVFILGGFIGLLAGLLPLMRANIRIKVIEKGFAKARKERDPPLARLSSSSDGGGWQRPETQGLITDRLVRMAFRLGCILLSFCLLPPGFFFEAVSRFGSYAQLY